MVVAFHAMLMAHTRLTADAPMFTAGAAGVDLFFVISGFIMVIATHAHWGKPDMALPFLLRRLIRIVPLYWLFTTLRLAMLLAAPSADAQALLTSWHTLASYLFIPAWNAEHHPWPLVVPGWTLSFEMLFYLLFAGALALRIRPIVPLTLLLALLAMIGLRYAPFTQAAFVLCDARLLEFVLGMWLARLTLAQRLLPACLAWCLVAASITSLLLTNMLPSTITEPYPLFIWGIPSAILLYAVVSLENHSRFWQRALPRSVGDASYAIYLSHELVISAVRVVLQKLMVTGPLATVSMLILSLVGACIAGIMIHRRIERPILSLLQGTTRPLAK